MKIHIKTLGFTSGQPFREYVTRRLSMALAHVADRLNRVVVRLGDTNGPKGGPDKTCTIHLQAPHVEPIVVTSLATDYHAAVELAARRAERAAMHALSRRFA